MRKIIRSICFFALEVSSAIVLTLGIVLLLLSIILHLTVGADNDAYIEIGEWGGLEPIILAAAETPAVG